MRLVSCIVALLGVVVGVVGIGFVSLPEFGCILPRGFGKLPLRLNPVLGRFGPGDRVLRTGWRVVLSCGNVMGVATHRAPFVVIGGGLLVGFCARGGLCSAMCGMGCRLVAVRLDFCLCRVLPGSLRRIGPLWWGWRGGCLLV